jgi:hypothetical protein
MGRPALEAKTRPNPSHFRRVTLSTLHAQYLDPVHKAVFIPLWQKSQEYEALLAANDVPFHTEDIAYTLPHLLEKVNTRAGVQYSVIYTETGRRLRSFTELPDYLSKLILGTETDQPPILPKRPIRPKLADPGLVLSSVKLPTLQTGITQTRSTTSLSVPFYQVLPGRARDTTRNRILRQSVGYRNEIKLSGEAVLPHMNTNKNRTIQEGSAGSSPEREEDLSSLFTPQQLASMRKEYMKLQQFTLVERVNEAVQSSSRLPPNIQQYLSTIRSKALGASKFQEVLVTYLQSAIPVLQGKPKNVFKAVLQGLGSDGRSLSWSQWLLLNALLISNCASTNSKISFVSKVRTTQMLGSRPEYLDIMVLLTSLCGNEEWFQELFRQVKTLFQEGAKVTPKLLRRKCLTGGLDYNLVLSCLRQEML